MLDARDLAILDCLQCDAERPIREIADNVHLSVSACARRIASLRSEGYIRRTVAELDRGRLGLATTIFVVLRARHNGTWLETFRNAIAAIPEIVDCHRLAGDVDYLLKIVVPGVNDYDRVYQQLISAVDLNDVSAYFSMETIKERSALPLRLNVAK